MEYIIEAYFDILSDDELQRKGVDISERSDDDRSAGKHIDNFRRRAKNGRCFKQPYLGTREFSAHFELIENDEKIPQSEITGERDLGIMLYDIDFKRNMEATFFRAKMVNGVIEVPHPDSEEVLR